MKIKIIAVGVMLVLIHSSLVFAKQELMLSKEVLFDSGPAIDSLHQDCDALFYVDSGKDVADMRRDFRNYFCEGMYTLTLDGPAGATVTLFGSYNFGQERGYLVLRKKDDRKIWLLELEDYPTNRWSTTEANAQSGAYEAFYYPAPNFRRNVTSVKWNQWWPGSVPGAMKVK
ncbi:hypothetical protein MNBD_NITROSPINAE05-164 [hydrothermal vent metagenome]|uniref:Uncharacterized protein n=1 Tax=hydrothermal vent metagenome TaxID=652676 RepID=A0A3B1D0W6_9ZZZZ